MASSPFPVAPERLSWRSATVRLSVLTVAVALGLGLYARPQAVMPPNPGSGRLLPRVPSPPPDLPSLLHLLGVGTFAWYAVLLSLPALLWASQRVDVARIGRVRLAALVAGTILSLVLLATLGEFVTTYRDADMRPPFDAFFSVGVGHTLLPFLAAVACVAAVESRRRGQRAALDRERLRAEAAEQRLVALTGQLEPHFLFNTLQNISTLIHKDPNAADEMLTKLSDLLRDLLRHRDSVMVRLSDEIRYARTYLEIAQIRFADRLAFDIDVAEIPGDPAVPLFILQPLIENALRHGIGAQAAGGRISIKVWSVVDRLFLEVVDNGRGLVTERTRMGVGLQNTRERLATAFGSDQTLVLENATEGGVIARMELPLRAMASRP